MPVLSLFRCLKRRRGGPAVEGAMAVAASALLILGVLDVGTALFVAQSVQRSADAAAAAFASGAPEATARAQAIAAAPGFIQGCIGVSVRGWATVVAADFGGPGGPVDVGTRVVRIDVSCAWGWLTPGVRVLAGPSATFRAVSGAALP